MLFCDGLAMRKTRNMWRNLNNSNNKIRRKDKWFDVVDVRRFFGTTFYAYAVGGDLIWTSKPDEIKEE
jgi:hypothetical protein